MLPDPYIRRARILQVIDGDTVEAEVDLGFGVIQNMRIRLKDVWAPETRGGTPESRKAGELAKLSLQQCIDDVYTRQKLSFLDENWLWRIQTFKSKTGADVTTFNRYVGVIEPNVLGGGNIFGYVKARAYTTINEYLVGEFPQLFKDTGPV